jgi:hypothetical protein
MEQHADNIARKLDWHGTIKWDAKDLGRAGVQFSTSEGFDRRCTKSMRPRGDSYQMSQRDVKNLISLESKCGEGLFWRVVGKSADRLYTLASNVFEISIAPPKQPKILTAEGSVLHNGDAVRWDPGDLYRGAVLEVSTSREFDRMHSASIRSRGDEYRIDRKVLRNRRLQKGEMYLRVSGKDRYRRVLRSGVVKVRIE